MIITFFLSFIYTAQPFCVKLPLFFFQKFKHTLLDALVWYHIPVYFAFFPEFHFYKPTQGGGLFDV